MDCAFRLPIFTKDISRIQGATMNAVTLNEAKRNLEQLVGQVIAMPIEYKMKTIL
jgi:hypothetical protein